MNIRNINNQLYIKKLNFQSDEKLYLVFDAKEIDYLRILKEKTKQFNYTLLYIFIGMLFIACIFAMVIGVRKQKI